MVLLVFEGFCVLEHKSALVVTPSFAVCWGEPCPSRAAKAIPLPSDTACCPRKLPEGTWWHWMAGGCGTGTCLCVVLLIFRFSSAQVII